MIYLYAITDWPDAPLPTLTGLEDAPLLNLVCHDVAAVASRWASPDNLAAPPPVEANLWRHEAILEALMTGRTVLPVRFGTLFANEAALQAEVNSHYAGFVVGLKRVCGLVELSLRVMWEGEEQGSRGGDYPSTAAPSPLAPQSWGEWGVEGRGREYLLSRLEAERRRQAFRSRAETLAAGIHHSLTRLSVESVHQVLVTPRLLLKAAYLVAREQVPAFRQQIEGHSQDCPSLHFLCTGPWPPYNFVNAIRVQSSELSNV